MIRSRQAEAELAQILTERGPRAAERWLLEEIGRLAAAIREEPELCAVPVRIVVPSRSLRRHVATGGDISG